VIVSRTVIVGLKINNALYKSTKGEQVMKTRIFTFVLTIAICILLLNNLSFSQEKEQHFFVVTTWKTVMSEGGSAAERDSLMKEWTENVLKKNEKIISQKNFRHYYGSDMHDWVTITEYKTWSDIEEATKISQKLNKKNWPDVKKRSEFFKNLGKYFGTHSDEI